MQLTFQGEYLPSIEIPQDNSCFIVENQFQSQQQSMVNGYSQSVQLLSLILRGILYENCMNPSFLEIRNPDPILIPIHVLPAAVQEPLEDAAEEALY